MKPRLIAACCWLGTVISPVLALAAAADAPETPPDADARLQGYKSVVAMDSGTMVTWMLFVFLALICLGVLFKDAKRSYLD